MDTGIVEKAFHDQGRDCVAFNSVREALKSARSHAYKKDLIFVGGSSFVVAEVV
jgi:dihydrofolate synthase/folylpolyglutamate synthase